MHNRIEGRDVEFYELPVALRELSYADGRFYINGEATDMSWYDMSPDATVEDVCRAVDAGHRALRFTAGCVDESVLAYCDAEGVYVAVTAPINSLGAGVSRKRGGNPSNDPKWREDYVERTLQLYYTTKRHTSIVAYVLADDSANGICLYESYLALKAVVRNRPVFYFDGSREWNSDHLK
jgi:beta-galactosidase